MGLGKKTGGRDFKKGQCPNPRGRPKETEEQKRQRRIDKKAKKLFNEDWERFKLTRPQLRLKIFKFLAQTQNDNQQIFSNAATSAIDAWIIKIIHEGVNNADEKRLLFLLDQALGKLPNTIGLEKDSADSWAALVRGLKEEPDQEK